jgi:hypothetical protein
MAAKKKMPPAFLAKAKGAKTDPMMGKKGAKKPPFPPKKAKK